MKDAAEEIEPGSEQSTTPIRKRMSGKLALILFLVLFPLLIVPALLTGQVHEKQICVHTLQQREASYWVIGSYPVGKPVWTVTDKWPVVPPVETVLFSSLPEWTEASPSQYYSMMSEGEIINLWETTERELALAFVLPVLNRDALMSTAKPVVTVRMIMAKSLGEEDQELWQKLNSQISEEAPLIRVPRRGYKKSDTDWDYTGQKNAADIVREVKTDWGESADDFTDADLRRSLDRTLD